MKSSKAGRPQSSGFFLYRALKYGFFLKKEYFSLKLRLTIIVIYGRIRLLPKTVGGYAVNPTEVR